MSAKDLLDSLIPEAYGRRPQGSAILPIGAVNLKTGRNQLFGPNGLETIRNFIEKPHHQTNWRAVADLLAQAFIP
jgi:hypothetical protein